MASTSETGHAKNVANLETMISYCTGYGTTYKPSNPEIALAALTTLYNDSKAALKLVKTTETSFNDVEGQRKLIFKSLKPLSTKIFASLQSSGVPSTVLNDAQTINRKIQGQRANNTTPITTPDAQIPKDKISISQQSYDMQIDHFEKLIELTLTQPKYSPNETPIKTTTLSTYKTQLQNINTTVKNAYTPYFNAMIVRNKKLYDIQIGLTSKAKLVKAYVKSIYGASSPEYKGINSLSFRTIK